MRKISALFAILAILSACKTLTPDPQAVFSTNLLDYAIVEITNESIKSQDFTVEWGDGQSDSYQGNRQNYVIHQYADNGTYNITLKVFSKNRKKVSEETKSMQVTTARGNGVLYSDISIGAAVEIYVNGKYAGKHSHYWNSGSPNCGNPDAINVTLPPGTYQVRGVLTEQGINAYLGDITIRNDECSKFIYR